MEVRITQLYEPIKSCCQVLDGSSSRLFRLYSAWLGRQAGVGGRQGQATEEEGGSYQLLVTFVFDIIIHYVSEIVNG